MTFRMTIEGRQGTMEVSTRIVAVEPRSTGAVVRWDIALQGRSIGTLQRSCDSAGIEDPWFGYAPGLRGLVQGATTWKFPRSMEPGRQFGGETAFELPIPMVADRTLRSTMERRFVAGQVEHVQVPAGDFEAVRLEVAETSLSGDHREERQGTLWLARGVGLVRAEMSGDQGVQVQELLHYGTDS